eukprot:CAMPEP_0204302224 /NCGR_PEP_ID=MMETSP0468-20130131/81786_1 /ASSEMBLY_ACC=CAM_ASM_000383 /TAXON_ID=2969 /ORGANISM="Oxyrrhis marina" /LENGTH=126 /DNA_ID=CAMNT_0051281429 /DNA_START=23 /DNA_END=403 /DNA_ORIENTATION=+
MDSKVELLLVQGGNCGGGSDASDIARFSDRVAVARRPRQPSDRPRRRAHRPSNAEPHARRQRRHAKDLGPLPLLELLVFGEGFVDLGLLLLRPPEALLKPGNTPLTKPDFVELVGYAGGVVGVQGV